MTALGGYSCTQASRTFGQFLQSAQNSLPSPWRLDSKTGTFSQANSTFRFQVNLWR